MSDVNDVLSDFDPIEDVASADLGDTRRNKRYKLIVEAAIHRDCSILRQRAGSDILGATGFGMRSTSVRVSKCQKPIRFQPLAYFQRGQLEDALRRVARREGISDADETTGKLWAVGKVNDELKRIGFLPKARHTRIISMLQIGHAASHSER